MKYTKLNGKYAGFPRWRFMMQFPRNMLGRQAMFSRARDFTLALGPSLTWNSELVNGSYYKLNEHWHLDTKRHRIYFADEGIITLILLKQGTA